MRNLRDAWDYLTTGANWGGPEGLWHLLVQQLLISVTALLAAMLVGLTLALWLGHLGRAGFLSVNITNVGRAVPTFALLAILVTLDHPGTATFGPYGRAGLATLIALALFALPPIYTNAYVAVREVPPAVKESAAGMGMTGSQQFWRVELPIALPVIVSGLRIATVTTVGLVPISGILGSDQGGLGTFIFDGLNRFFNTPILVGGVLTVILAVVLDVALVRAEYLLTPWTRRARP